MKTPTDPDELARMLKVLSAGVRVRIVQLLTDRALCVNALADRLDVSQGAVSQHLRVMRDAGLVTPERRGYYVHYRLNESVVAQWREAIDGLLAPAAPANGACRQRGRGSGDPQEGARSCARARPRKAARSRRT